MVVFFFEMMLQCIEKYFKNDFNWYTLSVIQQGLLNEHVRSRIASKLSHIKNVSLWKVYINKLIRFSN